MEHDRNRRLIEVSLPFKAISAQSAREKSIRHGHIRVLPSSSSSTLREGRGRTMRDGNPATRPGQAHNLYLSPASLPPGAATRGTARITHQALQGECA